MHPDLKLPKNGRTRCDRSLAAYLQTITLLTDADEKNDRRPYSL
jgi:hypothetical protein